jgi:hypothetical protein
MTGTGHDLGMGGWPGAADGLARLPPHHGKGAGRSYLEIRRLSIDPAMESKATPSWDTSWTS